ncbi:hypothetical protein D3C79_856240 [compost metagenome]
MYFHSHFAEAPCNFVAFVPSGQHFCTEGFFKVTVKQLRLARVFTVKANLCQKFENQIHGIAPVLAVDYVKQVTLSKIHLETGRFSIGLHTLTLDACATGITGAKVGDDRL